MKKSILISIITGLIGFILGAKWSDKIHNESSVADAEFYRYCCDACPGFGDLDD